MKDRKHKVIQFFIRLGILIALTFLLSCISVRELLSNPDTDRLKYIYGIGGVVALAVWFGVEHLQHKIDAKKVEELPEDEPDDSDENLDVLEDNEIEVVHSTDEETGFVNCQLAAEDRRIYYVENFCNAGYYEFYVRNRQSIDAIVGVDKGFKPQFATVDRDNHVRLCYRSNIKQEIGDVSELHDFVFDCQGKIYYMQMKKSFYDDEVVWTRIVHEDLPDYLDKNEKTYLTKAFVEFQSVGFTRDDLYKQVHPNHQTENDTVTGVIVNI